MQAIRRQTVSDGRPTDFTNGSIFCGAIIQTLGSLPKTLTVVQLLSADISDENFNIHLRFNLVIDHDEQK